MSQLENGNQDDEDNINNFIDLSKLAVRNCQKMKSFLQKK